MTLVYIIHVHLGCCLSDLFFRAWRLGWVGLGWEGNVELGPTAGSCHGRDLRCGARIPTLFLDDAWWCVSLRRR